LALNCKYKMSASRPYASACSVISQSVLPEEVRFSRLLYRRPGSRNHWVASPIGSLTQSLLEYWHEKSRDLSGSGSRCACCHRRFCCTVLRRRIGRTAEPHSERSDGLQRRRPLLARTRRTPRHHPQPWRFIWIRSSRALYRASGYDDRGG